MTIVQHPSPNHGIRLSPVDMLLLHYTGMQTGPEALERLCDPEWGVSAHYLVEEDGQIFQLVDESLRAHHAGLSFWQGERDTNSRSIGIEIVNPGHELGYRAFPDVQIKALIELSKQIVARYAIPRKFVLAHSDVAPSRKTDPGELFPWGELAASGIGIAPPDVGEGADLLVSLQAKNETASIAQALLGDIGYDSPVTGQWCAQDAINMTAFQRHFYPKRLDGLVDSASLQALQKVADAIKTLGDR